MSKSKGKTGTEQKDEGEEEKGKARGRDRLGSREIRDKRKNKTRKDATERKITRVYRN